MRRSFLLYILAVSMTGCATTSAIKPNTEAKLIEANRALDRLVVETDQFYTDIEAVRQEVRALYAHPGWPEMREIIEAMELARNGDDDDMESQTFVEATTEWTGKWGEPWEGVFSQYLTLVKRCSALEAQRLTLQSTILGVQAKYLGAAVMEYSDGRYSQGESINQIVDVLRNSAAELDSYTVDSMGLYE